MNRKREKELLMFGIACIVMIPLFMLFVTWEEYSAGEQCVIEQENVFGIVDMKNYAELKKALKIKDDIGVQELIESEKVLSLSKGTGGLVLGSTVDFAGLCYYRRIRILTRAYHGKTVWIPNAVLYSYWRPASSK